MERTLQPSLYVGDLEATVTENQLINIFSVMNGFRSALLCKDEVTGASLRYGYVNFYDRPSAMVAMAAANNTRVNGKAIRVMWQHDEARKIEDANVFVKNLDSSMDNIKLRTIFSKYGNISSCKVQLFEDGSSKGYGYVQFEKPESARKAIEELHGQEINGKKIFVDLFKKKGDRYTEFTNLYIKNLEVNVTEETLQEKFSEFGNITSLVVSKDSNGVSKGFGFVNFEKPEDAKKAMESMNGAQLGSKVLYVARAQCKEERDYVLQLKQKEHAQRYKGLNVYVKHIHDDVDEDELKKHFERCGRVNSVKIMRTNNGISRGFGFVCFSTRFEAEFAITSLNGTIFYHKPLYVAIAQTKEERRRMLMIIGRQRLHRTLSLAPPFMAARRPPPPPPFMAAPPHTSFMAPLNHPLPHIHMNGHMNFGYHHPAGITGSNKPRTLPPPTPNPFRFC